MAWTWTYLDAAEGETARSATFPTRADAEAWLGTAWEDLASDGVAAVALVDDAGVEVYRMSLAEDGSV